MPLLSRLRRYIPDYLIFLVCIHAGLMLWFSLFRGALILSTREAWSGIPWHLLPQSLWMGFRFDTVICAYLLFPVFLVLALSTAMRRRPRWLRRLLLWFLGLLPSVAFFICAADIPYFLHFNTRLTVESLQWIDSPWFVLGMVAEDSAYYPYLIGFLVLVLSWVLLVKALSIRLLPVWIGVREKSHALLTSQLPVALITTLLLIAGARGRLDEKSPIRWGTAFFSTYPIVNQTSLNPVFTLIQSWRDSRKYASLSLMTDQEALDSMRRFLGIGETHLDSPIAREVVPEEPPQGWNVVLVIMENMSAAKMAWKGNPNGLTPRLDSIARRGTLFTQMYGAGTHTYNGVYSTLFGLPGLLHIHPMKDIASMQKFGGIAWALKDAGYSTLYFTTHDEQFDNIGGFLGANGFDRIVSKKDYPPAMIESTLGVPDHALFELAIPELRRAASGNRPFFATLLTASDHSPYVLPTNIPFRPRHKEISKAMVEYADWSLGRFMELASREPWYSRTLFAFVADHGTNFGGPYDVTLSLHTIPFILLEPGSTPSRQQGLASQVDVGPTLLGRLRLPWINTTLGIDLLRERRDMVAFCEDRMIACLDSSRLYIRRPDGRESLHAYRSNSPQDLLPDNPEDALALRRHALAFFQCAQVLIQRHLVFHVPVKTK